MISDAIKKITKPINEEKGIYDVYGYNVNITSMAYKTFYLYKAMRSKRISIRPMLDSYSKLGREIDNEK